MCSLSWVFVDPGKSFERGNLIDYRGRVCPVLQGTLSLVKEQEQEQEQL